MIDHAIVSREEWLGARRELLRKEKELTRQQDELSRQRRELPWVRVTKEYVFDSPRGKLTLSQLFDGRSQLIIYNFMLPPGRKEGCVGCSFLADHLDGPNQHLTHHDVTLVVVARAPLHEIEPFKQRMGWRFPWVSSFGSDFNYDFNVSFTPEQIATGQVFYNYQVSQAPLEDLHGTSVFLKDERGNVFHTYSTYGRGGEALLGAYRFIDLTPKGRQENGPTHSLADWVRHHDRYDAQGVVDPTGRWIPAEASACCKS